MSDNASDPQVEAGWIDIPRDGGSLPCFRAFPPARRDDTPGIVLAMHLFGVDTNIRAAAIRFAAAGFATIVPDLYARFSAPSGDDATDHRLFVPFAMRLTAATVDPDLRTAAAWMQAQFARARIAIAGFCMGGRMAALRSAGYADVFAAAAVWYGLPPEVEPARVDIPIVASYGENDTGIPITAVDAFERGLRVPHDIVVYPGAGHAFCDDTRDSYEPHAAEDSWLRATAFLRRHLDPNLT